MTSGYILKILFRDGHTEEHYCDGYQTADGLLSYNIRFGVNSGLHCIPYELIREFTVER